MTTSTFAQIEAHPNGRYSLEWMTLQGNRIKKHLAVYEVTGKKNNVYVECSLLGHGQWMPRHYFEHFVEQIIKTKGGIESKPTSRGWQKISAS